MIKFIKKIIFSTFLLAGLSATATESVNILDLVMDKNLGEQSRIIDYVYFTCGNLDDKYPVTCATCEESLNFLNSSGLNGDICPIEDGESGTGISGGAKAENTTFSFNQIQVDGIYGGGFGEKGGKCCGGGFGGKGAPASMLKRHFTSRKGGILGDFGLDQSSSYDFKLRLMVDSNGKNIADIDSPNTNFSRRVVDGRDGDPMDGVFHDQLNGAVSELKLMDDNNQLVTDFSLATKAELYAHNREMYEFEIIQMGTDYVGRLKSVKDRNGYGIDVKYKDEEGLFTSTEIANSPELQWQRHTVTDSINRVTTFDYHSTFTVAGNYVISQITLPNNKTISYNYSQDNLSQVDYPDLSKSTYTYNVSGNFTHFIANEVNGVKKEIIMSNNTVGTINGTDQTTSNGVAIWNQSSLLLKTALVNDEVRYHVMTNQTTPHNLKTIYQGKGKLTEVHNGWWAKQFSGNVTIPASGAGWDYASVTGSKESKFAKWNGHPHSELYKRTPTSLFDDQGNQFFYEYDGNKVTKKTYPDSTFETWQYNQFRQITRYRDRLGRVTKSTFDSRGNILSKEVGIIEVSGVDQNTTDYAVYNFEYYPETHQNQFLLKYEWDANNNRKEYIYNSDNQLVTINEPNDTGSGYHTATTFTYDPTTKKLLSSTDAIGRTTSFGYDDRERLISKTFNDGSTELHIFGNTDATVSDRVYLYH